MARLPSKLIPTDYQKILLVHPTKYLGNLLITGNLIQEFYQYCAINNKSLYIVVDEQFKELLKDSLPSECLIFYPRKKIQAGNALQRVFRFLGFTRQLKSLKFDFAFNLEEDSVTNRLTLRSGAKFKLGCSQQRHGRKYDHVLPISFTGRPLNRSHRWHCYYELFAILGMPEPAMSYLKLAPELLTENLQNILNQEGVDFTIPIVVMHAGASNDYKKWPLLNFVKLAESLVHEGFQPVFIGNGEIDKSSSRAILNALEKIKLDRPVIDLVDKLSLAEVASFLVLSAGMVGNDSGPFHLASALGLPGCVIFGPTDKNLWSPLSVNSHVITGTEPCEPECLKAQCPASYKCLHSITSKKVYDKISVLLRS